MNYTFNIQWIQPFESCWCTSEKFKFANAINGVEYASILGISKNNKCLANIDVISKLEKITAIYFNNLHITWIKSILGPLYCEKNFDRYFATYLRYCPKCISLGYHTIYTQLLWVTHCPFHNIPLEDRVSTNRTITCRIPMGIHHRKKHGGFELKSDVSSIILTTRKIFEEWKKPLDVSFITNHVSTYTNYYYNLHYMPFSLVQYDYMLHYFSTKKSTMERILLLNINTFITLSTSISPNNLIISIHDSLSLANIEFYIKSIYFTLYRSIAKHLRKQEKRIIHMLNIIQSTKILQNRQSAIQLVKKGILTKEVYAYILWSRDILGYDSYLMLKPSYIGNANHIIHSPFYKYLMYEVKEYSSSNSHIPLITFLSLLQSVISKLFFAQYKSYYDIASTALEVEDRRFINLYHKALGSMPLLVSYYDKSSDICYLLDSDCL